MTYKKDESSAVRTEDSIKARSNYRDYSNSEELMGALLAESDMELESKIQARQALRQLLTDDQFKTQFKDKVFFEGTCKKLAKKYGLTLTEVFTVWRELFEPEQKQRDPQKFEVDVEPSPDPVNPYELAEELLAVLKKFIVFQEYEVKDAQAKTCVLWVLANWSVESFNFSPYLQISSPEKRCGKSQLLGLLGNLSRRPLETASVTAQALFRLVEIYKPTVFIDEVDSFLRTDETLQGILKCGIERGKALAWRLLPQPNGDYEPRGYDTFAFKAFSGIKARNISDTITDRCITISLVRKLPSEKKMKIRDESPKLWENLNAKCARMAKDHRDWLKQHRPYIPEDLNDRDADKWEVLFSIADLIDHVAKPNGESCNYGQEARRIASILSQEDAESPDGIELLANIKELFADKYEFIATSKLLEDLTSNEEWRWSTYNREERPLTRSQLTRLLRSFNIKSKQKTKGDRHRGYCREAFKEVFTRFIDEEVNKAE